MSSQPGWGARALGSVIIYQRSSLRYARSYRHTLESHRVLRFCIDFSSRQAAPCSRAHTGRRVDHELGGVAHERPRALHGARTRSPRTITPGSRRNSTPHRAGCCEWSLEWPEGRSGGMLGGPITGHVLLGVYVRISYASLSISRSHDHTTSQIFSYPHRSLAPPRV